MALDGGGSTDRDLDAEIEDLRGRLAESGRRLEETEALARIGSWEWELPELRSHWSKELLRIFGRDPAGPPPTIDELIAAVHPDDRAGFQELVARVRQTPGPFRYSYRILDADGEVCFLQALGQTAADASGRPIRAYGTTQDISELKRSEAQLEQARRLETVGQLAGGVAHDFNNLLSVILNRAECLIGDVEGVGASGETLADLREIEKAAATAADLTRRLLLFSRREATDLRPVDLAAAVADAEALLRRTLGEQVELAVEVDADLPAALLGAGQAEQVLINLAVNARDAMPEGGRIAISLSRAEMTAADGSSGIGEVATLPQGLRLRVADEGVGMSEETLAQAFDPFFTTKSRERGTGLGLATVYGIVTQAGGRIGIESRPGEGTVVSVHLPAAAPGNDVAGRPPRRDREPGAGGRTVLVVDNEEAVRTVVSHMLKRHGYRTVEAASGAEVEAMLAGGEEVDLLLTDVAMPGMSGWELVERLPELRPSLPAICMSGFVSGGRPSADGRETVLLEKPFTAHQLLAAMREAMGRASTGAPLEDPRE